MHFRRPYNYGKATKLYKGDFGFDWLRDEYIFPIQKIGNSMTPALKGNSSDIAKLKKIYTDGVSKIQPWGSEYIPSHLSIFATGLQDKNASSQINKNGVVLNVEIHQIAPDDLKPLDPNDGTKIIFETSEKCIKISTSKGSEKKNRLEFPISNFLKNRIKIPLGNGTFRWAYNAQNIIKISCEGATTKGALILIKAKKGTTTEVVGQMSIFGNDKVPLAKICLVDVTFNQNKVQRPKDLFFNLKYASFNQALIRTKIVRDTVFNVKDLLDKNKIWDIEDFYNNYYKNQPKNSLGNSLLNYASAVNFKKDLIYIFQKYAIEKGLINSDGNDITYVFLSNVQCTYTDNGKAYNLKGSAIYDIEAGTQGKKVWGNAVVMFHHGSSELETVVHEIVHSFGLNHIFVTKAEIPYTFYQGYTDNFMDYEYIPPTNIASSYHGNQISLFRHQWLLMRGDRSLDYKG